MAITALRFSFSIAGRDAFLEDLGRVAEMRPLSLHLPVAASAEVNCYSSLIGHAANRRPRVRCRLAPGAAPH